MGQKEALPDLPCCAVLRCAVLQEPGLFHHVLVNADLETAYQELVKLISTRVPGLLHSTPESQQPLQQQQQQQQVAASSSPVGASGVAAGTAGPVVSSPSAPGAAALTAGAAAMSAAALVGSQQQQPQQVLPALANGNGNISSSGNANATGGTAGLLDFGFGASAGPAAAAKGMPVRQYMDATVIPVLRDGLKALNLARPDDPLQFLADYLVAHKAAAC